MMNWSITAVETWWCTDVQSSLLHSRETEGRAKRIVREVKRSLSRCKNREIKF